MIHRKIGEQMKYLVEQFDYTTRTTVQIAECESFDAARDVAFKAHGKGKSTSFRKADGTMPVWVVVPARRSQWKVVES